MTAAVVALVAGLVLTLTVSILFVVWHENSWRQREQRWVQRERELHASHDAMLDRVMAKTLSEYTNRRPYEDPQERTVPFAPVTTRLVEDEDGMLAALVHDVREPFQTG